MTSISVSSRAGRTTGPVRSVTVWLSLVMLCVGLVASLSTPVAAQVTKPGVKKPATKPATKRPGFPTAKPLNLPANGDVKISDFRSRNFIIHTDLPKTEAEELLKKLETMLTSISKYWGRPLSGTIECYVVKDLKVWPDGVIEERAIPFLQTGGGLTATQKISRGPQFVAKSVVYAVAERGTTQHEAVHAYCSQTFGSTGPTWYSEGMAEMGQYWREGDLSVNAHDIVIDYLTKSRPKPLTEIVSPDEKTGDSWQNYAWRWALCHLLAHNGNYSSRFRPLGLNLLTGGNASFEQIYGSMAKEITFEYHVFLHDLEKGYRADLCTWDWKAKFKRMQSSVPAVAKIEALRGWQPARIELVEGEEYEFQTTGTWNLAKGESCDANGKPDGKGRLVGIVFDDYKLREPFDLGVDGTFTAKISGDLYLRCREPWGQLGDNSGSVSVKFNLKKKEGDKPAADPKPPASP